jgi:hypothetical protein|tara:strand:+ start:2011 stop:2166 length:156 start_codon:yes stop_codon:yes gene_type:complete
MKEDKSPSEGKTLAVGMPHDAKARMEQLEKAQEKWEKKAKSVNGSLTSGDK